MQRPSLAIQDVVAARDSPTRRRTRTGEASLRLAPCSRTPRAGSGKGVAGTSARLRPPGPRGTRLTPWPRWPRAGSRAGVAREWVPTPRKSFLGPGQGAGQDSRDWLPTPWLGFLVPDRFLLLSGVSFLVAVLWECRFLLLSWVVSFLVDILWGYCFLLLSGGIVSCCCLVGAAGVGSERPRVGLCPAREDGSGFEFRAPATNDA